MFCCPRSESGYLGLHIFSGGVTTLMVYEVVVDTHSTDGGSAKNPVTAVTQKKINFRNSEKGVDIGLRWWYTLNRKDVKS
jgi:hypothetical protein